LGIKDCVSRIPLREDGLLLFKRHNLPALADGGKECMGIEIASLLDAHRQAAPVTVAAKTQPENKAKMNEVWKVVTNYDITNRKKRKFLCTFGFTKLEKRSNAYGAGLLFRFGLARCRSVHVKKGRLFRIAQF
jgi:hypothetical protein